MNQPYTLWALDAPFDKHGVPRMGTVGQSIRRVVVMDAETFKRLIAEHPELQKAEFRIGRYETDEEAGERQSLERTETR